MCGLTGYCGPNVDLLKFDMIAIANESRGEDSSGICVAEDFIFKDTERYSTLRSSINFEKKFFEYDSYNIMAHCRKRSTGSLSKKAAHPYIVKDKDDRQLVLMHNGTISNRHALAKHYKQQMIDFETDSELLTRLIADKTDVLKYYEGGAALIWKYVDEPDTFYVFKGASETLKKGQAVMEDERTLFYAYLDGGMYISSMEEPLIIIGAKKTYSFPQNTIVKVVNGKIKSKKRINRETLPIITPELPKDLTPSRSLTKLSNFVSTMKTALTNGAEDEQKLAFLNGMYYLSGKPLQGEFNLNKKGLLDVNGKTYYAYQGYILKTKLDYELLLDSKYNEFQLQNSMFKLFVNMAHPDVLIANSKNYFYKNGNLSNGLKVNTLFIDYDFDINTGVLRSTQKKVKEMLKTAKQYYGDICNLLDKANDKLMNTDDSEFKKRIEFLYNITRSEEFFTTALEYYDESISK